MAGTDEINVSLLEAIRRTEAAARLVDDAAYPTSTYLIERVLD